MQANNNNVFSCNKINCILTNRRKPKKVCNFFFSVSSNKKELKRHPCIINLILDFHLCPQLFKYSASFFFISIFTNMLRKKSDRVYAEKKSASTYQAH